MWILILVDGMVLIFALTWVSGGLCGCCNYETIVLPTSRELSSDFSGLLLMGYTVVLFSRNFLRSYGFFTHGRFQNNAFFSRRVSYASLFLSTIVILVGIVFVMVGSIGMGLMCPIIKAENFSEVAVDQVNLTAGMCMQVRELQAQKYFLL